MATADPVTLPCPACKRKLSVEELLDHSTCCWLPQKWLGLTCPRCKRHGKVAVARGFLATGDIDGAPGPCFMPVGEAAVKGLTFRSDDQGMTVRWRGGAWTYPAR